MGISVTQLFIILIIVIILFGTKRLRNLGTDLGGAIKSFRSAVKDGEKTEEDTSRLDKESETIEGEVTSKDRDQV